MIYLKVTRLYASKTVAIILLGGIFLLYINIELIKNSSDPPSNIKHLNIESLWVSNGAREMENTAELPFTSTEAFSLAKFRALNHRSPPKRIWKNETAANCSLTAIGSNKYYIVTMLGLFNGKQWSRYKNFSRRDLDARDAEYLQTLEYNINHELVAEVHLFYKDESSLKIVKSRNYTNHRKITPVKSARAAHMSDFFIYASRWLLDKPVIAMNGDIVLGEGFQYVNTTRMRDEKVLYSLTRYNIVNVNKSCERTNWQLSPGYEASHDAHMFRLAKPLNEVIIFDLLDFPINMWGAENAMIWTFRFALNFTVRNPCPVLSTFHNHCSRVHGPNQGDADQHKYSIYYLPNRNWTLQLVRDSFADFETCLFYG